VSTSWWKEHFRELFRLDPRGGRGDVFDYLDDRGEVSQEHINLLHEIASDPLTHPKHRIKLQNLLGAWGFVDFAEVATDALATANIDEIHQWIQSAPFFSDSVVNRGATTILTRALPSDEQVVILDSLYDVAMTEYAGKGRSFVLRGPFATRKQPRDMAALIVAHAERLMEVGNLSKSETRTLLLVCAQYGSERAIRQLTSDVETYLDSHDAIDHDDWSWLFGIVYRRVLQLDASRLWQILDKGHTLPMYDVVRQLIAKEGPSCYPALVDYVNAHPKSSAMAAVYHYFEENAERKGLNVRYVRGKLEVSRI
jgi:hypothetical protein